MSESDPRDRERGGIMLIPRSRGATSGFLLILLGVWGALIPFFGHHFGFGYTPDEGWTWTAARGWLQVLPGAATALGGVLLVISRNRATAMLGGWVAVVAGAWFVMGNALAAPLTIESIGPPVAQSDAEHAVLELAYFSGLGTVIVFLGAIGLGRLSVRSMRDIHYAQRTVSVPMHENDALGPQMSETAGVHGEQSSLHDGASHQGSEPPIAEPDRGIR
jgi:hypothetical protein